MSSSKALQQQQLLNKKLKTLLQEQTNTLANLTQSKAKVEALVADINAGMIDGGFPSDNYSNITTIDGGTP
jgi:hypothetical protein